MYYICHYQGKCHLKFKSLIIALSIFINYFVIVLPISIGLIRVHYVFRICTACTDECNATWTNQFYWVGHAFYHIIIWHNIYLYTIIDYYHCLYCSCYKRCCRVMLFFYIYRTSLNYTLYSHLYLLTNFIH